MYELLALLMIIWVLSNLYGFAALTECLKVDANLLQLAVSFVQVKRLSVNS